MPRGGALCDTLRHTALRTEPRRIASTTLHIRPGEQEKGFIANYAKVKGQSVSDFARRAMLEHIEDELDVKIAEIAWEEFLADPVTYSAEEIAKEFL